jgi:hypothetical protein
MPIGSIDSILHFTMPPIKQQQQQQDDEREQFHDGISSRSILIRGG